MGSAAEKIELDGSFGDFKANTREQALEAVHGGDSVSSSYEQAVTPLVRKAAAHLVQRNGSLDLVLNGQPYDVLQDARTQLAQAGLSTGMMRQALQALEDFIADMGGEFSQKTKPRPLYARITVTDKEPDDLPEECEQTAAIHITPEKSYGSQASRVIRYLSVFGPKSTTSQGVELASMFSSNQKGLFIFLAKTEGEGVGAFDNIDAALVSLGQAAGGAVSQEELAELEVMIREGLENGTLSPEILELVNNLAELSAIKMQLADPENYPEAAAQLAELSEAISAQIEGMDLPDILADFSNDVLVRSTPEAALEALVDTDISLDVEADVEALLEQLNELIEVKDLDPDIREQIEAQIENLQGYEILETADISALIAEIKTDLTALAASESISPQIFEIISETLPTIQSVEVSLPDVAPATLEQLSDLSALGSEDLLDLINQLAALDNPPEVIQQILEQINVETLSPEIVERALNVGNKTELGELLQQLSTAIQSSDVQLALPQETLDNLNQFLNKHDGLVEAVSTQAVVQSLESISENTVLDPKQAEQIQTIVEQIKQGEVKLSEIDPAALAQIADGLNGPALEALQPVIEKVTEISQKSTESNVIVAQETREQIKDTIEKVDTPDDVKQKIETAIEKGDDAALIAAVAQTQDILQTLPPEVQQTIVDRQSSENAKANIAMASETTAAVEKALSGTNLDVPAEIQKAVQAALDSNDAVALAKILEANPQLAEIVPPATRAEIMRVAEVIDQSSITVRPEVREQINESIQQADIPDDVKQKIQTAIEQKDDVALAAAVAKAPEILQTLSPENQENFVAMVEGHNSAIQTTAIDTTAHSENIVDSSVAEVGGDFPVEVQKATSAIEAVIEKVDLPADVELAVQESLNSGDIQAAVDHIAEYSGTENVISPAIVNEAQKALDNFVADSGSSISDLKIPAVESDTTEKVVPIKNDGSKEVGTITISHPDTMRNLEVFSSIESTSPEAARIVKDFLANPQNPDNLVAVSKVMGDKAPPEITQKAQEISGDSQPSNNRTAANPENREAPASQQKDGPNQSGSPQRQTGSPTPTAAEPQAGQSLQQDTQAIQGNVVPLREEGQPQEGGQASEGYEQQDQLGEAKKPEEDKKSQTGCPDECDGERGCCPDYNEASGARSVSETAQDYDLSGIGGMDELVTTNDTLNSEVANSFDSGFDTTEVEVPDSFQKPEEDKKPQTGCPDECDGERGCCPDYNEASGAISVEETAQSFDLSDIGDMEDLVTEIHEELNVAMSENTHVERKPVPQSLRPAA